MSLKKLSGIIIVLSTSIFLSAAVYAEAVWIDVRSSVENQLNGIEGDVHIPHSDILQEVQKAYPDKNTEIHLYCLRGGRAESAKSILVDAGYTKVSNEGGISEVRTARKLED